MESSVSSRNPKRYPAESSSVFKGKPGIHFFPGGIDTELKLESAVSAFMIAHLRHFGAYATLSPMVHS
jgi:hypothetical protein